MLFNSFEFLVFFPLVTVLFFLLPHRFRWFHLLVASCIFYMAFIPVYIIILLVTIVIDYIAGIYIEKSRGKRRKYFLVLSIIANVGVLAIFKYYNFFAQNINDLFAVAGVHLTPVPLLHIILPVGLSFHTFQAMSYTIEVYRGTHKAEKHFGIYALYVMFYPQLVAGPIERPQNILYQFHEKQTFNYHNAVSGLRLMMWGMFKKVVIADRLALYTDLTFAHPDSYSALGVLVGAVFFSFQIFCDFSGYSDIALGAARVMGFKLMKNFNAPYHAKNIAEFWKRWHISLSTWFRDYLYISLGGNRVSVPRWYFNLFFVFLVSGFWHGANWTFIFWGALHGFYLVFAIVSEKFRKRVNKASGIAQRPRLNRLLQIVTTYVLVTFAWIFFRADNMHAAWKVIKRIAYLPSELHLSNWAQGMPFDIKGIATCFALITVLELVHTYQGHGRLIAALEKQPRLVCHNMHHHILWGI